VFRRTVRSGQMVDGITTAAAVFATAAIGAAAGAGLLAVAALATALVLIALEGTHLPLLRLTWSCPDVRRHDAVIACHDPAAPRTQARAPSRSCQ
jgi:uncharacterized membrane protein YhiD involved in acid resistance